MTLVNTAGNISVEVTHFGNGFLSAVECLGESEYLFSSSHFRGTRWLSRRNSARYP
jgi:hypothetical protein